VFVIREKPHIIFKREGDNLICNEAISLKEALCGFIKIWQFNIESKIRSPRPPFFFDIPSPFSILSELG
jgi:DnaJ-class molecular chaperone